MNKNMKKILLIIIAAVLAVALISIATVNVVNYIKNYVGDTVVSFDNQTALTGDTVKIPFSIIKNHGLWGGQVKINYDADVLEFVSCANGSVFDECEINGTKGSVNLLVNESGLDDSKTNGIIATLNFKIKETAKKGDSKIVFDQTTTFCDNEGEVVEIKFTDGIITVK